MKVLLSWLQEFAPFPDDPDAIGEAFSDLGTPVEEVEHLGAGWDGIVVARVLALRAHPAADRIQLVDVDAGQGADHPLQICCGAFNMAEGDLVPLATLGATMPGGMVIERRKLRGEWSNGMLCSGRELGLGDDHSGILVLDGEPAPGIPLAEALGVEHDVLWELEVNPNRPDAMSVAGLARDLAARLGLPFSLPVAGAATFASRTGGGTAPTATTSGSLASDEALSSLLARIEGEPAPSPDAATGPGPDTPLPVSSRTVAGLPVGGTPAAQAVSVDIVDPDLCGRFGAWVLRDVQVGESPGWMQRRLVALGMRPINALVDISNYVMLELGQPNHPYDLARVAGSTLRVRRAGPGEQVVTLDDVTRTCTADDLLICDGDDRPVGIAGIMGGADTEISADTTDVLLEMAWFLPMSISRSSRRLGLRSDASARFEKGCDPEVIPLAAARFCQLAAEICGATVAPGFVDARGDLPHRPPVRVRTARVNAVLGTDLTPGSVADLLAPIGFAAAPVDDDHDVVVPPWRYDSATEIDVIEEVARHHGYRNIPLRELAAARSGGLTAHQRQRRGLRRLLAGLGLAEALPLPFLAPGDLERCGLPSEGIELLNPLVAEESVLRTSLLPGLVKAVADNASRRALGVGLFEIGHVFRPPPEGQLLPDERERVGVILAGRDAAAAVRVWQVIAEQVRALDPTVANADLPGLHPTRGARCTVAGDDVGVVGEIDPAVLAAFGIDERVGWVEVDLGLLLDGPRRPDDYRTVSRFPSSDIDLAFTTPDAVSAVDVERTLAAADPLVWSVALFDTYRGDQVPPGTRSLAYRLRLQAPDHTLTDAEVAAVRDRCIAAARDAHGADLRG